MWNNVPGARSQIFLPGASAGRNTADTAELQFFMGDQSYDYTSRSHTLRVIANPTTRLDLKEFALDSPDRMLMITAFSA